MKQKQRLAIVGNGMATGRARDLPFETAADACGVAIFNAEPRVNCDRIMLSPVLPGGKPFEDAPRREPDDLDLLRRHAPLKAMRGSYMAGAR